MARRSRQCNRKGTCGRALGRRKRRRVRGTKVRHRPSRRRRAGCRSSWRSGASAVVRLRGAAGGPRPVCDSRASTRRRPLAEPMRLVPSARAPRRAAVQRFARTPEGGGTALRAHCTEARHGTVRTHPLQVCLASLDEAPIRSVYGRHPSRLATVGPGADVRDVTGEVGQQEAEWTAKRYTAVRRGVGAGGMVRGLSGATAPGRRRRSARWRCAPRLAPCTRRSARQCLRHTAAGPCGAAIAPLLRRTGSRRLRAHAPRAWIRPAIAFFSGSGWR